MKFLIDNIICKKFEQRFLKNKIKFIYFIKFDNLNY